MDMTPERWRATGAYLRTVFGREDEHLARVMPRAIEAGIPDIAVSADVGRLLLLLARLVGARRALELGTLAGYSGVWIARGLSPGGRLITIEPDPKHADFAARTFADAGVAELVEIRRTTGLEAFPALGAEFGQASFDLIFLDAIKTEYPEYWKHARTLVRPGGLILADNALGGRWWIDEAPGRNPDRDAVDRFNRLAAADPDFDVACVPIREGVLIARRR